MNNLPLQPLVWTDNTTVDYIDHRAQGAGVSYRVCYFADKFRVYWVDSMGGSDGNKEFNSLDELKHWVNTDHYPHKMQPYVKPMPTWIDVNNLDGWISIKDKLPTHHQDVIVYRYDGEQSSIEHSLYLDGQVMVGFGNVADEDGFFDDVYYWQPIETKALYEAMAMRLQISEVVDD